MAWTPEAINEAKPQFSTMPEVVPVQEKEVLPAQEKEALLYQFSNATPITPHARRQSGWWSSLSPTTRSAAIVIVIILVAAVIGIVVGLLVHDKAHALSSPHLIVPYAKPGPANGR